MFVKYFSILNKEVSALEIRRDALKQEIEHLEKVEIGYDEKIAHLDIKLSKLKDKERELFDNVYKYLKINETFSPERSNDGK